MKLNLGCGADKRAGWTNLDALPELEPDLVHDLRQPLPFANGSVEEVLAQDILEHFTKEDVASVIAEISRVLQIGGKLTVRVPNIDDIIERFQSDPETRNEFLYGTTAQTGVFGAHKVGYTPPLLVSLLLQHSLTLESLKTETTNYLGTFKKTAPQQHLKKLIYLSSSRELGRAEELVAELLPALSKNGVDVVAYVATEPLAAQLQEHNVRVEQISGALGTAAVLRKEHDADVILLTGLTDKIIGSPLTRLFGLATVWLEAEPIGIQLRRFGQLPKALYRSVKGVPEKVLVVGTDTQRDLITKARVSLAKIAVVPREQTSEGVTEQWVAQLKNAAVRWEARQLLKTIQVPSTKL